MKRGNFTRRTFTPETFGDLPYVCPTSFPLCKMDGRRRRGDAKELSPHMVEYKSPPAERSEPPYVRSNEVVRLCIVLVRMNSS